LSAQWGGPNGIETQSLEPLFLQCFDTVGWVFGPIKRVPDMTYNVFGGTLNLAQFM